MAISERALKRVRGFLNPHLKAKLRYVSLKEFHEFASELEKVEFFERHGDTLTFFLFECYVACLSKIWLAPVEGGGDNIALWFAFGVKEPSELGRDTALTLRLGDLLAKLKPERLASRTAFESALRRSSDPADFLRFPVVFSWLLKYYSGTRLVVDSPSAVPLVCLVRRLLARENAPALQVEGVRMLLSLLKVCSYVDDERTAVVKGLYEDMLASLVDPNVLSASWAEQKLQVDEAGSGSSVKGSAIRESLVKERSGSSVKDGSGSSTKEDSVKDGSGSSTKEDSVKDGSGSSAKEGSVDDTDVGTDSTADVSTGPNIDTSTDDKVEIVDEIQTAIAVLPPLLRGKHGPLSDMGLFNEILAFITWDANADLHSSRYLYAFLRDRYLTALFPDAWAFISSDPERDLIQFKPSERCCGPPIRIQNLLVEYLSIWLLKSATNTAHLASITPQLEPEDETLNIVPSNFGSTMAKFLGLKKSSGSKSPGSSLSTSSSSLKIVHGDLPMASFLLEEIILDSPIDIGFVHLILRNVGVAYMKQFTDKPNVLSNSAVKMELEIFRSWLFNPSSRRPSFLADDNKTARFMRFYLRSLRDLFQSTAALAHEAIEVQREALYFYRAVALQAFIALDTALWEFLLEQIIAIAESGPQADESLLLETLLGCLIRAGEHGARESSGIVECWKRSGRVFTAAFAAGNRIAIEEWCRVVEAMGVLLARDPSYLLVSKTVLPVPSRSPTSSSLSSHSASTSTVTLSTSLLHSISASSGFNSPLLSPTSSLRSMPAAMAHFSAWPDLATVRRTTLFLFRNLLRLTGDLGAKVDALHELGCMNMLMDALSMLERLTYIFLRLRQGQPLRTSVRQIPPFGDLLIAALSVLLKLTRIDSQDESYVMSRVLAWRMVGGLMLRPADFAIPKSYWGVLLMSLKAAWRRERTLSAVELKTILKFVAVPLSTLYPLPAVSLAGVGIVLAGLMDRLADPDGRAIALLGEHHSVSALLQFIVNCVQLSVQSPGGLASYRDCSHGSSFLQLLQTINEHMSVSCVDVFVSALMSMMVSEGIRHESSMNPPFLSGLIELFLQASSVKLGSDPLLSDFAVIGMEKTKKPGSVALKLTKNEVNVIVTAFTTLATVQASISASTRALFTEDHVCLIIHGLLDILSAALVSSTRDMEAALLASRLYEETLPAFFLHALPYGFLRQHADIRTRLLKLSSQPFPSNDSSREQWLRLFMSTVALPFDLTRTSSIGAQVNWLLHVAVNPARVILSFGTRRCDGRVVMSTRSAVGRFEWVCEPMYNRLLGRNCHGNPDSGDMMSLLLHGTVVEDDEFAVEAAEKDAARLSHLPDQLRLILNDVNAHFPECQLKVVAEEDVAEFSWREQSARESEFVSRQRQHRELRSQTSGTEQGVVDGGSLYRGPWCGTMQVRALVAALGLGLPELSGLGVSLLSKDCRLDVLDAWGLCRKISVSCWRDGAVDADASDYVSFIEELAVKEGTECSFKTPMFEIDVRADEDTPLLICWHASVSSLASKNPVKSSLTRVIVHVLPVVEGQWYLVSRQVRGTRPDAMLSTLHRSQSTTMKQGRDPFSAAAIDSLQDFWASSGALPGPAYAIADTLNVEGFGVLVPRGVLGALVRSMILLSDSEEAGLVSPVVERQKHIDEVIAHWSEGYSEVPKQRQTYDRFLARLFKG